MNLAGAVPDPCSGKLPYTQIMARVPHAAVVTGIAMLLDQSAGPSLAATVVTYHVLHRQLFQRGPPHPFAMVRRILTDNGSEFDRSILPAPH